MQINFATSASQSVRLSGHDLFATRIWQARLPALRTGADRHLSRVEAMRAAQPQPAGRTNRGGWNSISKAVLDHADFADIAAPVRSGIRSALAEMGHKDLSFALESWVNLHDLGGFNFLHVHEGAYLCGCLYLRVPPGSGNLIFRDPRPGAVHGFLKGPMANGYRDISLAPEPGLLVLFPPWLEHFVEPHNHPETRIAIAFNAVDPR